MAEPIDLRSDTVTLPSPEMRRAMYEAEMGDDYYRNDPTVRALEEKAADRLGKESALLVLSGTMGNLVAVLALTRPGQSIVCGETSHIYVNETGGLAAVAGLTVRPVKTRGAVIGPAEVEAAAWPNAVLHPPTTLVCIENTNNAQGGRVFPESETNALSQFARAHGMAVHVDGARIFNAAVALGVPAARLVAQVDSITFCLTKGLACPAGSIVAGPKAFIEDARHWRQMVGGGMRQGGCFAAAGLVALDRMVDRLAEDHANARLLATLLGDAGLPVDAGQVETNMVFTEVPAALVGAEAFVRALKEHGIVVNPPRGGRVRFVTHYGITESDVRRAGEAAAKVVAAVGRRA